MREAERKRERKTEIERQRKREIESLKERGGRSRHSLIFHISVS